MEKTQGQQALVSELSVALLFDDVKKVKEFTQIFRRVGVVAHFYQDLKSFWHGVMEKVPSLCLVDVKMMNQGELLLSEHPLIKRESLPISFYYSDETTPLLYSTYEFFHLGVVREGVSFQGQIKSLLKRLNRYVMTEQKNRELTLQGERLDKQIHKVIQKMEGLKEKEFYTQMFKALCTKFEQRKFKGEDFFTTCEAVLGSTREIKEFTLLELDHNGQKLISPHSFNGKYRQVPSLWLGQTCKEGIALFAQNMAAQVCLDLMGGELMSLNIRGMYNNPDKILFIRTEDTNMLQHFDWENFERFLSGVYLYYKQKNEGHIERNEKNLGPWELLSFIDHFQTKSASNENEEHTLVDVNFSELSKLLKDKVELRFFWRNFYFDFINRFENQKKIDFKVASFGIGHVTFLVSQEKSDEFFIALKAYCSRYPYWRYFDDVDVVLARTIKPEVRIIPFSSLAYLRFVEEGIDPLSPQMNIPKDKNILWRQAPEQSM